MIRALRNIWENDFFKNVATLISGTTFAQAFSIVIYIFLSRIYSEEDFGVFGLYMNILNITIIFSTAISGVIFAMNPTAPFWLGGALSVLVFFPAILLVRQQDGITASNQQAT